MSSSLLSLRRDVDFHCDVQPVAPVLSQPFFHVLFKALVTGQKPQANLKGGSAGNASRAMALLPRLPMANASTGIMQRLAPALEHASEDAEMDEALSALDGLDPAVNSSGISVPKQVVNASGVREFNVSQKTKEPQSSLGADAARVNHYFAQMQCIFETMLSDHCGNLGPVLGRRQTWESVCLDPKHEHDSTDAYVLMSAEERKYSRNIRHMTPVGHHTVELWNDQQQYKTILCMQMKIVDDGCLEGAKEPRFSPAAKGVKSAKVVRGFVDSNKTRTSAKPMKKKVEIGTMSAEKDDAAKLVRQELEAVRSMK